MDHGSHTFYLAFDWMAAYPTSLTAHSSTADGHDTEDIFGCTLTFPTGVVSAHLSWTAGVRKVMYTLHGKKGAIRVEDEDVELAVLEAGPGVVAPGSPGQWRFERRVAKSDWMDASHVGWFSSLFDEFRGAIARSEYVGRMPARPVCASSSSNAPTAPPPRAAAWSSCRKPPWIGRPARAPRGRFRRANHAAATWVSEFIPRYAHR